MRREGEETQSLLSSSSSTNTTTKKRNTNYYYYYVALGVVASAGILGTVSSKSSSSAAFPRGDLTLGKDRPTIRLSVGCTPEDVLSLLPFEPKSWRGAVSFFFFFDRSKETRHHRASKRDSSFCGTRSKSIRILMRARARAFENNNNNNNNNNNARRRREGSAAPFSLCCASLLLLLLPLVKVVFLFLLLRTGRNGLRQKSLLFCSHLLCVKWRSLLLPTKITTTTKTKTTGKVGAKLVTANVSPNFSYENAIDMPEETWRVCRGRTS